jgi:hypothetical protein
MRLLSMPEARRRTRWRLPLLMATVAASMAVPTVAGTGVAEAAAIRGYAFLWANNPGASSYYPDPAYSANSQGGVNFITRNYAGSYSVRLPGLGGSGGNVQVVAQGTSTSSGARCKVGSWGGDPDIVVNVYCHSGNALVDSQFSLSYQHNSGIWSHHAAYAYSSAPTGTWGFNSKGGTNTVTNGGTGLYTATFPGVDLNQGNVQVTAYNGTSDYCKIRYWNTNSAFIACFDWAGRAVNTQFSVAFTANRSYTGPTNTRGSYGFAYNDSNTSWYSLLGGGYGWHSSGGNIWARKLTGTNGQYLVEVSNVPAINDSLPIVTAYGDSTTTRCRIGTWYAYGTGIRASVICQSAGGVLTNSPFSFAFLTSYT